MGLKPRTQVPKIHQWIHQVTTWKIYQYIHQPAKRFQSKVLKTRPGNRHNHGRQQDIQPIISTQQQSQSSQQIRVLIDWDELQDKMAEVHHKDIKSFWLCGRIENGTKKLLDMVLEREQPQMVVA